MTRRSHVKSSRGHVRVGEGPAWLRWAIVAVSALLIAVVLVALITQFVLPAFEDDAPTGDNRTWLEFAWTSVPVNDDAVEQLGERLKSHAIRGVYLECAAWRADRAMRWSPRSPATGRTAARRRASPRWAPWRSARTPRWQDRISA